MELSKVTVFLVGASAGGALFFAYSAIDKTPDQVSRESAVSDTYHDVEQTPSGLLSESSLSGESPEGDQSPGPENTDTENTNIELIVALAARLEQAELRIDELESRVASSVELSDQAFQQPPPVNEASARENLVNAGFDPFVVNEINAVRDDTQLQRLELRDQATREGWVDSERFREEFAELRTDSRLKEVLGEDGYDRLLAVEGRNNRVRVDGIIPGSVAAVSGVEVNDIIYRYADARIFTFGDLRRATSGGVRNESVSLQIYRDDVPVDLVVPRGPLGVTISGFQQPLSE